MNETGWLIERNIDNLTHWYAVDDNHESKWIRDASKAVRFARKVDAEAIIRLKALAYRGATATEHSWSEK